MKLVLNYWTRRWQSVVFDTDTGTGRVRWFAGRPAQCGGWAVERKGQWYALYRGFEGLVFQAGISRWPMTDAYRCRNVLQGAMRTFTVAGGGEELLALVYKAEKGGNDVTYDNLDLETSDFFYWAAIVWNDPALRDSLKSSWVMMQA